MRVKKSKSGQSMIEFALVLLIFLNLLVVTYNAVLAFGVQQYFSYAAFLTARALQASSESPSQQSARARAVMNQFVPPNSYLRLPNYSQPLAHILKTYVPDASQIPYGMKGPTKEREVLIQFEVPLFSLPFFDLHDKFPSVQLEAKSYLGREPTRSECRTFFQKFYTYFLPTGQQTSSLQEVKNGWTGMDDNDC